MHSHARSYQKRCRDEDYNKQVWRYVKLGHTKILLAYESFWYF